MNPKLESLLWAEQGSGWIVFVVPPRSTELKLALSIQSGADPQTTFTQVTLNGPLQIKQVVGPESSIVFNSIANRPFLIHSIDGVESLPSEIKHFEQ
jgi:hypothetical protein